MSISLVIMTNVDHTLAEFSLMKTISSLHFDEVLVFADRPLRLPVDYKFIKLPDQFGMVEYSLWCIKELYNHIKTDHFIIIHPDGMATNNKFWTNKFYDYDYIGAPFNLEEPMLKSALVNDYQMKHLVDNREWFNGNGGFTMRSMKLLEALQDDNITGYVYNKEKDVNIYGEDLEICVYHRNLLEDKYNIKFAPMELAVRFSTERLCYEGYSFGFHGVNNIPFFLTEEECIFYIVNMRPKYDYTMNKLAGYLTYKEYFTAINVLAEIKTEWSVK